MRTQLTWPTWHYKLDPWHDLISQGYCVNAATCWPWARPYTTLMLLFKQYHERCISQSYFIFCWHKDDLWSTDFVQLYFNQGQSWLAQTLINTTGYQKRQGNCSVSFHGTVCISNEEKKQHGESFLNRSALNTVCIGRFWARQSDVQGSAGSTGNPAGTAERSSFLTKRGFQ